MKLTGAGKAIRKVGVIGVGLTKFGEHWERSMRDLGAEAGLNALRDAKISGDDVQALYIGNMSAGKFIGQEHVGALTADQCGLNPIEATRVEAACASGSAAFRYGYLSIASGHNDVVVVGGAEKMTDLSTEQVTTTLMGAGDEETEGFVGLTFPGIFGLMAQRYMHKYGLKREELSLIPVKNHAFGVNNPYAQFRKAITIETVNNSALIADPLRLFDCAPITDGAAAVILASEDFIKERGMRGVWIKSSAQASDTLSISERSSITTMNAVRIAASRAYKQAGITPKEVDIAEVHDCFSIAELIAYEDLGFCERGKAAAFLKDGGPYLNGQIAVNTDGGLKVGHPVGATGVKQIVEVVKQLRRDAANQVKDARIGLTQNIGGSGATAVIHIFSGEE